MLVGPGRRNPQLMVLDSPFIQSFQDKERKLGAFSAGTIACVPQPSRPGEFHPEPLTGRVEDWRAGLAETSRPCHVSSPLHVARNVRISRIARPHSLRAKAYGTYPAGATFGRSRRTR